MVFAANYVVAKRLVWTPGGFALSFGRMLQDGIVKKYLDEHCPDPALRLCAVKDQLPDDADVWFWGSELFDNLGRFAGLGKEMETIALACVLDYPALQAKTAAVATARQLIGVHTGEGVLDEIWHTYRIIERYTPQLVPAMQAAHQQQGELSFTAINRLHYPLALLAMAAAAGDHVARLAPPPARRHRRTGRGLRACAHGQCLRLRRAVQPARPLWRAHGLARNFGGRSGLARLPPAAPPDGQVRRISVAFLPHPLSAGTRSHRRHFHSASLSLRSARRIR